ncbi:MULTISPECIES: IS4 family transposase [unclassified Xanthomonas]|uniref:IS4 family transposase n=1 Tax=Xanthomonas sp. LMG 9002 TaxID=1591158 RepID=UPI00136D1A90|nr:IS4 family transposase [Xanthomonas sp. LMG 9002]MXV06312.1 IS4 family transposase [Xanthomonas sp. LMG 9002]
MRASQVLQKCLCDSLEAIHALREAVLLRSVEALIAAQRLTLTDVARAWPGAERVKAPLKAFDRLLSNRRLHDESERIYADMARWLLRGQRPVIVIDWSDLKEDRSWCLLRAAVPIGGRTLPVLDMVFPGKQQGSPTAEKRFLKRPATLMPRHVRPILITDAGFRSPWFRAVCAQGWDWLGRLRGTTLIKPVEVEDHHDQWVPCCALHPLACEKPRLLPPMHINRSRPLECCLALYRKSAKNRKHITRLGTEARSKLSRQCAAREREPWLIVASPGLADISARKLVTLYGRRMQIESSFRDLKSHRYGHGLEDSLTHKRRRLGILLLVSALASFAQWLTGMGCEATGIDQWLYPAKRRRKLYSTLRVGREALIRSWPMEPIWKWLQRLRELPEHVIDQTVAPA